MVVPVVIVAVGVYFAFAPLGLTDGYAGLILAHTTLAAPFVVITVLATLSGFDRTLLRAAANLGAPPLSAFRRVTLPLILPGVLSGAVFAFAASYYLACVIRIPDTATSRACRPSSSLQLARSACAAIPAPPRGRSLAAPAGSPGRY